MKEYTVSKTLSGGYKASLLDGSISVVAETKEEATRAIKMLMPNNGY